MTDDAADLRTARNRWSYNQGQHAISMFVNDRSLIAWTLSPEWIAPTWLSWHEESRLLYRGVQCLNGREFTERRISVRNGEIVSGECGS